MRPRFPRLSPPLRPAARASSELHSWAVPLACAALPPFEAISRCFSPSIDANPRLLVFGISFLRYSVKRGLTPVDGYRFEPEFDPPWRFGVFVDEPLRFPLSELRFEPEFEPDCDPLFDPLPLCPLRPILEPLLEPLLLPLLRLALLPVFVRSMSFCDA